MKAGLLLLVVVAAVACRPTAPGARADLVITNARV
jgi:hypothetical protein